MINQENHIVSKTEYILAVAALFKGWISVDWLLDLTGKRAEEILLALEQGAEEGLLVKEGPARFLFSNNEQRLAARAVLDHDEKERLSQKIVGIFLQTPADDPKILDTMADHLLKTPADPEICRWLLRAGDGYRKSNHHEKAIRCYRKIIEDLRENGSEEADRLVCDAAMGYSRVSDAEPDLRSVACALHEAISRAQRREDQTLTAMLEMHLAMTDWMLFNFKSAFGHFNRGWAIARDLKNPLLSRSANAFTSIFLFYQGRFKEVIQNYEEIVPEVARYPQTRTSTHAAFVTGCAYGYTGNLTQGMGMLDSLYNDKRNKGDLFVESTLSLAVGWMLLEINQIDKALEYLIKASQQATEAPHYITLVFSLDAMAVAYTRKKEVKKAMDSLQACLKLCREINFETYQLFNLLEIYWTMQQEKIPFFKDFSFDEEIRRAIISRDIRNKGTAYRYQALLYRQQGQPMERVVKSLMLSVKWLKESGYRTQLAKTRIELAREYLLAGHEHSAKKNILKVVPDVEIYGDYFIPEDLRFLFADRRDENNLFKEMIKLGQDLVMIRDNRELARHIISTANRITGAERGAIFFMGKGAADQKPVLRAATNLNENDVEDPGFADSMKMITKTFTTEKGQIINRDSAEQPESDPHQTIRNRICVPMKIRGNVVGALYHDNRFFASRFKEDDLEILSYFAAQAAIAMDNAKAYEEIRSLNETLRQENQYYEEQQIEVHHFEEIVGESRAVREVIAKVMQVADTDSSILISGETGVGKELVARAIHRRSSRRDKPFIRVNCSAFPESLIAGELFGHEKGAFTGATELRIGRFELANKGTIFLDEIAEISMDVQVRLLRVLQSKEFERLGGRKTIRSDFRLITATNRDLFHDVKNNAFREDLYYRLNVFPINVPPLRERKEDIPLLAYYFLKIYEKKMKKPDMKISESDMKKLAAYHWPGNVRELENVIERGVILSTGLRLKIPDLIKAEPEERTETEIVALEENERRHIIRTLKKTTGVIHGKGGAAELLQIHPNTLYSKMKKLGIRKQLSFD
jgi:formate hydrogenlyase transcriptional activator